MRQMILGVITAAAVSAGAAPAMACGIGCAGYVPPPVVYGGCYTGCGYGYGVGFGYGYEIGLAYERLAEPTTQYYYVNQGPTYTGPGAFAPYPTYHESAIVVPGYGYGWHHHRPWHYGYSHYRYLPQVSYARRVGPGYGYRHFRPRHPHVLRRAY